MRNIFVLTAFLTLFTSITFAKQSKSELEYYQSIFGMEKRAFVYQFIQIDTQEYDTFWTIYQEYEDERKALGMRRIELLNHYVDNYETFGETASQKLVKDFKHIRKENDKLLDKYFKKVAKEINSNTALQFFQVEAYFQSVIRIEILKQVPQMNDRMSSLKW